MAVVAECVGRPLRVSRFYETDAWPDPADPAFINAVMLVAPYRDLVESRRRTAAIERFFGRRRSGVRNAPRTLDLDLVWASGPPVRDLGPGRLHVPHPRARERAFVLAPLADVGLVRARVMGKTGRAIIANAVTRGALRIAAKGPRAVLSFQKKILK